MKAFDEVVNDITKDAYCVELTEAELRKVFEMLDNEIRWEGTYHGWEIWGLWREVCNTVHKYMKSKEEE